MRAFNDFIRSNELLVISDIFKELGMPELSVIAKDPKNTDKDIQFFVSVICNECDRLGITGPTERLYFEGLIY